jgi:hypothetical protein
MSIGGLMVFDPLPHGRPPTVEAVRANLMPRLKQLPRYSQRPSSPRTGGLAWPRSQIPLYAFGARLREVYPVVPLAAAHAVGIAIFSYNGLATFGVIADSESTPDIGALADGIEEGIEELLVLAPSREPRDTIKTRT